MFSVTYAALSVSCRHCVSCGVGGAGGCVDCYNKHQTFVSSPRVTKAAYKAYLEEQDRLYAERLNKEYEIT